MPRCPNGSRKDKKTGKCVKVGSQKRCPKGTRKNKKTGNCEESVKKPKSVENPKSVEKPKSEEKPKSVEKPKDELVLLKEELMNDYEFSYKFVRTVLYNYMEEYVDHMNEEKNFGGEDVDGTDIDISKREFNEFIDKNIKSIYIITKRVNDEDDEEYKLDRIRPFYKKVRELVDNHEQ